MSAPEIKEKTHLILINKIEDEDLLNDIYQMVCEDSVPYQLSNPQKAQISKAQSSTNRYTPMKRSRKTCRMARGNNIGVSTRENARAKLEIKVNPVH
jgi:hypothetical protein